MTKISLPIYLDYAATTPVDLRVAQKMAACLTEAGTFGNPASKHHYGLAALQAVEAAREQVATFIQAEPSEIIWTSGATESVNLALKGVAQLYQRKGKHIITIKTEHKAVLDTCQYLEKEGYQITYLVPLTNGLITLAQIEAAMRADTILVAVMMVNNEIGVQQPIAEIAALTAKRDILLYVDAAQAAGKMMIDLKHTPVDLLSFSAHKMYGPKGVGVLYLRKRPRVRVAPLIHGGGHEQGMRSGTLATHQIVGMGEACRIALHEMAQENKRISALNARFRATLSVPNLIYTTDVTCSVPHIINLRFDGMIADAILAQLPMIAATTASACQGKGTEGSYVLRALGLGEMEAKSAIRFSFGRFTTEEEIDRAANAINGLFGG